MDNFKIDLKELKEGQTELSFRLDDAFFSSLEDVELSHGLLRSDVSVRRIDSLFKLHFHTEGTVTVPCDLCLDDMDQPVSTDNELVCKLGEETRMDDDLVIVSEEEGILDVAWFLYESIALNIPIRHVHAPGKCNPAMMKVLQEHSATRSGVEDESKAVDSRWAALSKLKN